MHRKTALTSIVCLSLLLNTSAIAGTAATATAKSTAPSASSSKTTSDAADLPVRRVVLYKNGVGYFEHAGKVRGDQDIDIRFTTGQLNDVLKSLTVVDLSGGQVTGVRYNSIAPLSERLNTLRVRLGEQTTRAELLNALRGAKVEIRNGATSAAGRLLSVESSFKKDPRSELEIPVTTLTIITDSGEMRNFELTDSTAVRLLEPELNREVSRYMSLISSSRAKDLRQMIISTSGTGERDMLVSYISEVPVWKSTYRLVLSPRAGEKALLQGWAIVDNTVGEDWNNVQLSLVAGAPQSFIQQISQPLYVRRPSVELPKTAMLTPQTHEGTMEAEETSANEAPAAMPRKSKAFAGGMTPAPPPPPAATSGSMYDQLAKQEEATSFATNSPSVSRGRITTNVATPAALGDLFEYNLKQKITVLQNQSALVPIVNSKIDAEKVTMWSRTSSAPLRALWVKNSSGLTLDGGTFNIIEGNAFAGEGLLQELKPDERRLLSYAADTAIRITNEQDDIQKPYTRIVIAKGLMKLTREQRQKSKYNIHNSDTTARQVVIEHPARSGWKFTEDLKPEESTASYHRFKVAVEPGKNAVLKIEEFHPEETTYVLTNLTSDIVAYISQQRQLNPQVEKAFQRILAKKNEISGVDSNLYQRRNEIDRINREQSRLRENMKALKGSAEEKALVQRYVSQLNQQEDRLSSINKEISDLEIQRQKLVNELDQIAQEIALDEGV